MQIQRYLRLMGRLYFEGARSNFSPELLRRFGGSLAMAARDANHIRIDPDSILGMQRRTEDRWQAAEIGWRRHSRAICNKLARGVTPTEAIYLHCAEYSTTPHTPRQLQQGLQQVISTHGTMSAWMLPTVQFRHRLQRGSAIMSDTFGAITTMAALAMSADDWQHATPEEWDNALNAGEVGVIIGQLAGAHTDAHTQRQDTNRTASARTN